MDGDSTRHNPFIAFMSTHSLFLVLSFFIKDLSHFLPSTLVLAFQTSFIIVGLVYVLCFVIAVRDHSVCTPCCPHLVRLPVPLDLFGGALRERVNA